jgi:hypothetical protein
MSEKGGEKNKIRNYSVAAPWSLRAKRSNPGCMGEQRA